VTQVEVVERRDMPGAWTVEVIDDDGGIEQAIFLGPRANQRAQEYAKHFYGWMSSETRRPG
jgi:hypothetical protein